MSKDRSRLEELRATGKLPSPKGAALRVMKLAQQDHVSIADVAGVLKSDPALAGKVLRVVNSAETGLAKPTADLPYAVSLLGLRTVRRLVLSFSVVANSPRGVCEGFDFDEFWRHSLATALASQAVCHETPVVEPEEAYCYGLLSQIGRLGLATVHPERYSRILKEVESGHQLLQEERRAFGIEHNQLTAALLADWGLPNVVVEAVLTHAEPLTDSAEDLALHHVLNFASHVADAWLVPSEEREPSLATLLGIGQRCGFTPENVTKISAEAMSDWSEWCSILEIESSAPFPLATAFQQLDGTPAASNRPDDTLRILVVDDDPMSLRYMERHLATAGHDVVTAQTAADALKGLLEFYPQVVITDWIMPEMNGIELCRAIRQTDIGRRVHLIMVTSHDDKSRLTEAFAAGCDDYITKPVHPQELCARTRAASRVIRLQAELTRENSEAQQHAAELSIGNRELQREAWTDALTGLPNRRFARERLAESWDASVRLACPFACIMLDIDHFKGINDNYGHPAGDLVLQRTAAALQTSTRRDDVVCRFGGEEFLVICPGIDAGDAERAAERIRAAIERNFIESELFTGAVTVSAGVADRHEGMTAVETLLKSADDALYEAKRAGRNCVRFATDCTTLSHSCG